jgi:hypothetical protein
MRIVLLGTGRYYGPSRKCFPGDNRGCGGTNVGIREIIAVPGKVLNVKEFFAGMLAADEGSSRILFLKNSGAACMLPIMIDASIG